MTVFVVTRGEYSYYHIEGIFSTRELAETFVSQIERQKRHGSDAARIEDWKIDERKADTFQNVYCVCIYLADGRITTAPFNGEDAKLDIRPAVVADTFCDVSEVSSSHASNPYLFVQAAGSLERAIKLATEARQAYKRNNGLWERGE